VLLVELLAEPLVDLIGVFEPRSELVEQLEMRFQPRHGGEPVKPAELLEQWIQRADMVEALEPLEPLEHAAALTSRHSRARSSPSLRFLRFQSNRGLEEMTPALTCGTSGMGDSRDGVEGSPCSGSTEGGLGEQSRSGLDGSCDPLVGRREFNRLSLC
jgi:hypothetical protein